MNKQKTKPASLPAKSVSVSLPERYVSYIKTAKRVKGWSTSELMRRALDVFMADNPLDKE